MQRSEGTPAWAASAMHTMVRAMTDPTERSMPPVMMTTSMPSARSAREAFCLRMLVILSPERNTVGLMRAKTIIITMTTTMMP